MSAAQQIAHWSGRLVEAWPSQGSGVLYLTDVRDNLVLTGKHRAGWPPVPIAKKLGADARASWFDATALAALQGAATAPCRLQSVLSEDAITWSLFGPLLDASEVVRAEFLDHLLELAGIRAAANSRCEIRLWRRTPHPDTGRTAHGPEADALLIGDQAVVCVESKWRARIAAAQGVAKNLTQVDMRRGTVDALRAAGGQSVAAVVLLAPAAHLLHTSALPHSTAGQAALSAVTWEDAVRIPQPEQAEVEAQLYWRLAF